MSEENEDEVLSNLRACVLSCKGGVTLKVLNRDYRDLVGTDIPHAKLGYKTLNDFVASLKDFRTVKNSSGDYVIQAIANDNTAHLAKLISHQKSKPKSNSQKSYYANRFNNNRLPNQSSYNKIKNQRPYNSTHWHAQNRPAQVQRTNTSQTNELVVVAAQTPIATSQRSASITPKLNSNIQKHLAGNNSLASWIKPTASVRVAPRPKTPPLPPPPFVGRNAAPSGLLTVKVEFPPAPKNTQTRQSKSIPGCPPSRRLVSLEDPQQPKTQKSPIQILTSYGLEKKLGVPIFKTISISQDKTKKYLCCVEVGKYKASDPSARENTPEDARQKSAKLMLEKLQSLNLGCSTTATSLPSTTNNKTTATRIYKMMQEYPHGLWASEVPAEYSKCYSEILQDDWLSLVEDNDEYELIKWDNNKVIVQLALELTPQVLETPETEYWDVNITSVVSATKVWVRVLGKGFSDELSTLMEDINTAKEKMKFGLKKIHSGKFMLALWLETIHRAEVLQWEEGSDIALCRLSDLGHEVLIPLENLACLPVKYSKLAFQAFKCCLKGLEVFKSEDVSCLLEEELLDKVFIARCIEECAGGSRLIELFDTSTANDININEELKKTIIFRMHSPTLPKGMNVTQVRVSHVSDAGDVYVHPQPASVYWLEDQLLELKPALAVQHPLTFVGTSDMYLASCPELGFEETGSPLSNPGAASTNKLGRVVLETSTSSSRQMTVLFIDYGLSANIELSALRRLPAAAKELAHVPPQVVQCRLRGVPPQLGMVVGERTVKRLRELAPPGKIVALRTSRPGTSYQLPQVELLSRTQPDNLVCSINDTIAMDTSLFENKGPLFPGLKQ